MISSKCNVFLFIVFCIWSGRIQQTSSESLVVQCGDKFLKEENGPEKSVIRSPIKIIEMQYFLNITNRYVQTVVRSKVINFGRFPKQMTFFLILPDSACITSFVMQIGNQNYTAYIKENDEARMIYDEAVNGGLAAAHLAADMEGSNNFLVSVNVEPRSEAMFFLTYEELLVRKGGHYDVVVDIRPGQPVKRLGVQVNIAENRLLKEVKVLPLRSTKSKFKPEVTLLVGRTAAMVTFAPTIQRQRELAKYLKTTEENGLAGQFVVQYDVKRDSFGGEFLQDNGYFLHFFAPSELSTLPKHIVFVLDTSGSTHNNTITRSKEAVSSILKELKLSDTFSLITFNRIVKVWNLREGNESVFYSPPDDMFDDSNITLEEIKFPPAYSANSLNIKNAISAISSCNPSDGTNVFDALKIALHLVERERYDGSFLVQPLIIFLTDGAPTVGLSSTDEIVKQITELNSGPRKSAIFALSFGEEADTSFLKKLTYHNHGFLENICEVNNATLQLQEFHRRISPVLANVTFTYTPAVMNLTKTNFPFLFQGSEIVVAGRYAYSDIIDRPVTGWRGSTEILFKPTKELSRSNLKRIWAYLMIKQLLEQIEIANNPDELREEALYLAMENSFVTPVSSLVIVKPGVTEILNAELFFDETEQDVYANYTKPSTASRPSLVFTIRNQPICIGSVLLFLAMKIVLKGTFKEV